MVIFQQYKQTYADELYDACIFVKKCNEPLIWSFSLSKQFNPTQKILTAFDFLSKRVKTQVIAKFEILQNRVERFESRRTT